MRGRCNFSRLLNVGGGWLEGRFGENSCYVIGGCISVFVFYAVVYWLLMSLLGYFGSLLE